MPSQRSRFVASLRADHAAMRSGREKYTSTGTSARSAGLLGDGIQKVGFQMMVAVRAMRLLRDSPLPLGGQVVARLIRHLYGAEIHWNAEIADGVSIVHGNGLVLSHGAVVGSGCILFQNVTLGESVDPSSRVVGAPTLERNVHVGPGAVLLGPITVGEGTKIMANSVLDRSVPARSLVRGNPAVVETRTAPSEPSEARVTGAVMPHG